MKKFNDLELTNYNVIEPVWDSFLYELYQSMIYRNIYGIKTSKLDLSHRKNINSYVNILISEFYDIIETNNFVFNHKVFSEKTQEYYNKLSPKINIYYRINPLIEFNNYIYQKNSHLFQGRCIFIPIFTNDD